MCVLECRSVIPEAISEYNALRRFVYRLQAWRYRNHGERQRTPSLHLPSSEYPARSALSTALAVEAQQLLCIAATLALLKLGIS